MTFPAKVVANRLAHEFSERPLAKLSKTVRRAMTAAVRAARASPEPPHADGTGGNAADLRTDEG